MKLPLLLLLSVLSWETTAQLLADSTLIDGHYRVFHFNKPSAKHHGASLVFVLHGSGGTGIGLIKYTAGLEQKAATENALVVYPDGYLHYWNECRKEATSIANKENIDEQAFFTRMIDYFKTKYQINEKHVFAVGTSGGGHMCYKLALTMPQEFRAVVAIIANLPAEDNMDCAGAGIAVPVMIINGTADPLNKYEGGMMEIPGVKLGRVRSTEETFHYWATLAGYQGDPTKEVLPDTDPNDGKTIERFTYKLPGKPEVVLLKVIGGKHDYPNDIDVHVVAWEFFKRQM